MRLALLQMNSQNDTGHNLETARLMVKEAARQGAEYVLLPENFAFFGSEQERSARGSEIYKEVLAFLAGISRELGITITGGGFPSPAPLGKHYNTAATFSGEGREIHRYNKLHLFDATPGDNVSYLESKGTAPGDAELSLFKVNTVTIGITICYDLRFPALYRRYAQMGANLLCVPSAFTRLTGSAHWHALVKARAIENTCYVAAAAQTGKHYGGRETFGHSLVVDPWGETVAEAQDRPGVIIADIDVARVDEVRTRMPSLRHDKI